MKVKFMNFKEMAITQNTGMCSYLTIAWAVPYMQGTLDIDGFSLKEDHSF